ncbi:hypothetical protein AB4865_08505 [Capnocytophaga sp. ARDL2]|uniref:hypothetical protein n=1 Tax=Capnocytophaga sp. ARDL2 TaxID=3238809 RepID=UPI0035583510
MNTQFERITFSGLQSQLHHFMDFQPNYSVKENKCTLSLIGNNLFNISQISRYSIDDMNLFQHQNFVLPRYIMLKGGYRF